MSHVPFFWKEKGFVGWRSFVLTLMNNTKKPWSYRELLDYIAPGNVPAQKKIQGAISGMLSNLKSSGYVDELKVLSGHTHYVLKNLVANEQDKIIVLADLRARLGIKEAIVFDQKIKKSEPVVEQKADILGVKDKTIYLTPRSDYYSKRIDDLINVVFKSFDQKLNVPVDWIEEYNELIKLTSK